MLNENYHQQECHMTSSTYVTNYHKTCLRERLTLTLGEALLFDRNKYSQRLSP